MTYQGVNPDYLAEVVLSWFPHCTVTFSPGPNLLFGTSHSAAHTHSMGLSSTWTEQYVHKKFGKTPSDFKG